MEEKIILNFNVEYKLTGIIACPSYNHYNSIIFNPLAFKIDIIFSSNYIYYHDGTLNNGQISQIIQEQNLQDIGIPYIVIYKFIDL